MSEALTVEEFVRSYNEHSEDGTQRALNRIGDLLAVQGFRGFIHLQSDNRMRRIPEDPHYCHVIFVRKPNVSDADFNYEESSTALNAQRNAIQTVLGLSRPPYCHYNAKCLIVSDQHRYLWLRSNWFFRVGGKVRPERNIRAFIGAPSEYLIRLSGNWGQVAED